MWRAQQERKGEAKTLSPSDRAKSVINTSEPIHISTVYPWAKL